MNNTMKRIFATFLSCILMFSPCAVTAEESTTQTAEKNFEYYLGLTDYEVYVDYCNTYGYESYIETGALPQENYVQNWFSIYLVSGTAEEQCTSLVQTPEKLGFPSDWYEEEVLLTEYELDDGSWGAEGIAEKTCVKIDYEGDLSNDYPEEISIQINLSHFFSGFDTTNLYNIYRLRLTLENSEFVKNYGVLYFGSGDPRELNKAAVEYYPYNHLITPPTAPLFGDINSDGAVDATDAALLLEYAAAVGAGNTEGTLEEYLASKSIATS